MNMSSLLLCGLILSCFYFRVTDLSEEIWVVQTPHSINVTEGESAQIICCCNTTTKVKTVWYKNDRKVSSDDQQYQTSVMRNCSTLNIPHTTDNHAGDYVCKVTKDIPVLAQYWGRKTALTVIIKQQTTKTPTTTLMKINTTAEDISSPSDSSLPLSQSLPLTAAAVLLIFCLIFSVYKMRNSCKHSERVIIHQTPHSEEEEEHENNEEELSTGSSRGSLQWYQVPVYWSYFDLQRGEDK